jgi:hypothetical protein
MNIIKEIFKTGKVTATVTHMFSIPKIEPIKNKITVKSNTLQSTRQITGSEYIVVKHGNPLNVKLKQNNESFF